MVAAEPALSVSVLTRADRLEALLPHVMRALYRPEDGDSLSGLSMAALRLVRLLDEGTHTAASAARDLRISPSSLTQIVTRLQRIGIVARTSDPDDRRSRHLSLSEHGQTLVAARRATRRARAAEVLSSLPEHDAERIMTSLEDLLVACRITAPGDDPPSIGVAAESEGLLPAGASRSGGLL